MSSTLSDPSAPARSARGALVALLAVVTVLVAACGGEAAPTRDDEPTGASSAPSPSDTGHALPGGWPLAAFPLPPGGGVEGERVTDDLVFFHVGGVEPEVAKAFYEETLPGLGLERSESAVVDPVSYAGDGLSAKLVTGDLGDLEVYLTRE